MSVASSHQSIGSNVVGGDRYKSYAQTGVSSSHQSHDHLFNPTEDDDAEDLLVTPSTLEVDYDKNLTTLYQAITNQDWEQAIAVAERDPIQAATWVVRHYQDENQSVVSGRTGFTTANGGDPEIMWRFLPLHSACARQPPTAVLTALIRAYPDAAKCVDDQGMYALHYACGNQAPAAGVRHLLVQFPRAALKPDPRGMLPLHYLACWGPSQMSVVDMLLVATKDRFQQRDHDGNTPLDLAMQGDYPEAKAVAEALRNWKSSSNSRPNHHHHHANKTTSTTSTRGYTTSNNPRPHDTMYGNNNNAEEEHRQEPQQRERTNSHGSDNRQQRPQNHYDQDNVIHVLVSSSHNKATSTSSSSSKYQSGNANRSSNVIQRDSPEAITTETLQAKQHQPRGSGPSPTPSQQSTTYRSVSSSQYEQNRRLETSPEIALKPSLNKTATTSSKNQQLSTGQIHSFNKSDQHSVTSNNSTIESHAHIIRTSGSEHSQSINNRSIPPVRSSGLESHRSHESNKSGSSGGPDKMSLQRTVQQQTLDLQTLQDELAAVRHELGATKTSLKEANVLLADTQHHLQQSRSECLGLQTTLGDLMEQHEQLKKNSTNTHERLASLSISLLSMREQQDLLTATVAQRNEKYITVTNKRRGILAQLQELDEELVSEEDKLGTALQKHTREMEAIAAVINAARCDS